MSKKSRKYDEYYCFVFDDNCHHYFIPVRLRNEFYDANDYAYQGGLNDEGIEELHQKFNKYRCMSVENYMMKKITVLKEN
jgi:hypothetical protein